MKNVTKRNWILVLVICLVIPLLAWVIWSLFTTPAITTRYATLIKPTFTAPNRAFWPVRTLLYILMWISLFLLVKNGIKKEYKSALRFFGIQLVLNILWSIIFFTLHNPLFAFIEIIVLWIMILVTAYLFYKKNKTAWLLFIPYLLRVLFATFLTYGVMVLN